VAPQSIIVVVEMCPSRRQLKMMGGSDPKSADMDVDDIAWAGGHAREA